MLNQLLTLDTIQIRQDVRDWKEAIQIAAVPLLKKGSIQPEYIDAMIENVQDYGPYIVLAPKIALAHARPEQGVKELGMSLLCLKESVAFSQESRHDANLIFVLAAADSETHLNTLSQLAGLLSNEEAIQSIMEADSTLQIMKVINQYSS
ncbi:PTS sugar transporter subunit IIA [Neobacillus terrae]|uniref:PTS sugar transporter subunit IIA n=1 Tax=Neobacillus terrae TaxID=3034837 RepID=UPI001408AC6C|nr:PTS sugar transporter subunit IIA [Neobacillus terrae]NHM30679.1 PTS sugar transporter subunit IIA [Neobacillus terrae]